MTILSLSQNLATGVKFTKVKDAQGAGTSAVTSDIIDMTGFTGVVFLTSMGTANAGNYIKIQQGAASTMSDAADLENTKVVGTGNAELIGVDVASPKERYLRAYITRTASTTVEFIIALQYGARKVPVDNTVTDETQIEIYAAPAEGTA